MKRELSFLSLLLVLFGLFLGASPILAACGDGICQIVSDYENCSLEQIKFDCAIGNLCDEPNCDGSRPANICCTPTTTCPSGWGTWDYAYDARCVVDGIDDAGVDCNWEWQYQDCSAADRCESSSNVAYACDSDPSGSNSTGKILAGSCSTTCSSGCANGGWYKTCCQVNGAVQSGAELTGSRTGCTDGGGCSSGARVWGTSCSGCLYSVDAYGTWTISDCATAPTAGPTTTEPTTPVTGSCAVGAQWCTNPDQCAASGCTVANTPLGACDVEGDICCSCPSFQEETARIKVNIVGTEHEVGEQVTVQVYQEPANPDTSDDFCYYDSIEVKVNNPGGTVLPPDYIICEAGGFRDESVDNGCSWGGDEGRCRTCIWDTNNVQAAPDDRAYELPVRQYPAGPYEALVYYGGHTDPVCSDSPASASDDTTLWGDSEIYFTASQTCTHEGECVPLDLTSGDYIDYGTWTDNMWVSNFDWSGFSRVWRTNDGEPESTGYCWTCDLRSSDNCPGTCAGVQSYNGSNFLASSSRANYSVSLDIQNLTPGREYLVSVYGYGVNAHLPDSSCKSQTRPFIKLESGSLSTVEYMVVDDDDECEWQKKSIRVVPQEGNITATLISKATKDGCNGVFQQSGFENFSVCECPEPVLPPTCEVYGNTTVSVGESVIYTVRTNNAPQGGSIYKSPTETESWTTILDRTLGTDDYPAEAETVFTQAGTYYVTCNGYGDERQCSGNPWCWGDDGLASRDCSGWTDCGYSDSLVVNVILPEPWYQTQGGNIYGDEIFSPIWHEATSPYFSLIGPFGSQSGLVAAPNCLGSSGARCNFGAAQATQTEFPTSGRGGINANFTPLLNDYSYDQLAHLVDLAIKDNKQESYNSGVRVIKLGTIKKTDLVNASAGLYYYPPYGTGDMAVSLDNPFSVGASEKLVIFVEDDLNINKNISVTPGGFLAFIVSGDIEIAADVTQVQGVYFADGSLTVESNGATADSQFNGQGIFVGKNGVSLERNFRDERNATQPTEIFTFDPAYLFTAPKVFREKPYLWQEVIP